MEVFRARPAGRGLWTAAQHILAPRAEAQIAGKIATHGLIERAGPRVLDVGCGPGSRLARSGVRPVGLDRSASALRRGRPDCRLRIWAEAAALPFTNGSFDSAWCFGLLHHLDDEDAVRALGEMRRVTRPGGLLVVFDGVLPLSPRRRPLASLIRSLDRGRHMRSESALRRLLADTVQLQTTRFEYASTGLEGLLAFGIVDPEESDAGP